MIKILLTNHHPLLRTNQGSERQFKAPPVCTLYRTSSLVLNVLTGKSFHNLSYDRISRGNLRSPHLQKPDHSHGPGGPADGVVLQCGQSAPAMRLVRLSALLLLAALAQARDTQDNSGRNKKIFWTTTTQSTTSVTLSTTTWCFVSR